MRIIQKRKIWLSISGAAVITSIVFLSLWGLNFGIDFTGGSLLEVNVPGNPGTTEIQSSLSDLNLKSFSVQQTESGTNILRFQETSESIHKEVINRLNDLAGKNNEAGTLVIEPQEGSQGNVSIETSNANSVEELRFDSVGPSIGKELKSKAFNSIIIVLAIIIIYIAFAFRKVSKPVASWKYGIAAVIALFHDIIITLGVFAFLGHFYGIEINAPFVAAILTLLGYSINDTIVVFDRIRENLPKSEEDFENTLNSSVNQTVARSINTSMTVLMVLLAIVFFGGNTIRDFVVSLSVGVFVGTYSSIFVASPLLVVWEKMRK